jgi:transcriptional regulator with XRE-family HTH domain
MLPIGPNDLGGRIKRYRRHLGENQEKFGARFGVKRLAVHKWEHGKPPNPAHLTKLMTELEHAEAAPVEAVGYQFELPFEQPFELAVRMSPSASQSIHFHVQIRSKAS